MPRGRPKTVKDPYEGLPDEWRSAIDGGTEDEIRQKLSAVALEMQSIIDDMLADEDYQSCKTSLKMAGEGYRDRKKLVKLKVQFATRVLESRGRV